MGCPYGHFTSGCLYEIGATLHCSHSSAAKQGGGGEFSALQDDLEQTVATGTLHGGNLTPGLFEASIHYQPPVDHNIDLVGTSLYTPLHLTNLQLQRQLSVRKGPGHCGYIDSTA